MNTVTTYRHGLHKGSKKWRCVQCGQKTAVLYIDNETGELLPDHVSRCDREHNCGYHYTPKQYFAETGNTNYKPTFIDTKPEPPAKVDFLPIDYLDKSVDRKYHSKNNFYHFLVSLFGEVVTVDLFTKYCIGTSSYWKGAAMFPQIDEKGNLRQVKLMLHDKHTGKRIKEGATVEKYNKQTRQYETLVTEKSCSLVYGKYLDEFTRNLNLEQTFFGCHLLTEYPKHPVCVVESEKTAILASVYMPQFVWIATGGASGCKWREHAIYKVLKGRSVTFFPDYGIFNKTTGKTCYAEWCERVERIKEALQWSQIRVSDVLEQRLAHVPREDQDLADLLLTRDWQTGIALEAAGYPIAWDYKFSI